MFFAFGRLSAAASCSATTAAGSGSSTAPAAGGVTAPARGHEGASHRAGFWCGAGGDLGAVDDLVVGVQAAQHLHPGVIVEPGGDLLLDQAVAEQYPYKGRGTRLGRRIHL